MKNLYYLILPVILLISCGDDYESTPAAIPSTIVGTWQLTSQYTGPGDSSGTFQPVVNGKSITVNADGTYDCNVSICFNSLTAAAISGTYTADQFISADCAPTYTFINDVIDLQHPCVESCIDRYTRVD